MRGRVLATAIAAIAIAGTGGSAAHANQVIEYEIPARGGEVAGGYNYAGPPRARAILPDGYDPKRSYPVLYVLHGFSCKYSCWTNPKGIAIDKHLPGLDAIVVMPEGGTGGWYTDAWNGGRRGNPAWESYFLDQVIPQTEARFRIRPERRYHALAGSSMGGLGTAYLGGRLPGYFGSLVVMSGFVDTQIIPAVGFIQSLMAGGRPEDLYGPLDGPYATGHNPARLAGNLTRTRVLVSHGTGAPQGGDTGTPGEGVTEGAFIQPMSLSYVAALRRARVDVTHLSHPGYHDAANDRRQMRDALGWGLFQPVPERPATWTNDTVAGRGKLWDLRYRFDSPPTRVARFSRDGRRLQITAAGSPVTLTTDGGCVIRTATPGAVDIPARPCARLTVRVRPRRLRTGRMTRVRIAVRPAASGVLVRSGRRRARTSSRGVAYLRVCARTRRGVKVAAGAPNFLDAGVRVRARGRAASCRRAAVRKRRAK
ncbi:MAG TPA: alpha/beta hydrolase-fold protein [Thermoleophilaceae bacterium]|nr:alpha/beta hydrolase-fold protein [Thermoleophilaceae bacterium]